MFNHIERRTWQEKREWMRGSTKIDKETDIQRGIRYSGVSYTVQQLAREKELHEVAYTHTYMHIYIYTEGD